MSDRSNRTFEALEFLAGMYDVPDPGVIRFRLCTAKGNAQLDMTGMNFRAHKDGQMRQIFPKGLHVARDYVVMRLAPDALPKGWLKKCSITLVCGKLFTCYPNSDSDISDSLTRPEIKSDRPQPQEAATA